MAMKWLNVQRRRVRIVVNNGAARLFFCIVLCVIGVIHAKVSIDRARNIRPDSITTHTITPVSPNIVAPVAATNVLSMPTTSDSLLAQSPSEDELFTKSPAIPKIKASWFIRIKSSLFAKKVTKDVAQPVSISYPITVNAYGDIIDQDQEYAENTVADTVIIHSQKSHDSFEKIDRKGLVIRYKEAKATVLISHGFMCDKYLSGSLHYVLPQGTYNFMTFDFRAHGEDTQGQQCTFGRDEAYDVIAAAKFLRNHPDLQGKPLFAYGFSMGAVASIEAQAKDSSLFDAMILDCPFDSTENVIKTGLNKMKMSVWGYEFDMPGRYLLEKYAFHPYVQSYLKMWLKITNNETYTIETDMQRFSPLESIKLVKVPCFFIHCKNDERVPMIAVKNMYESASGYKKLWLTDGRGHFDSFFFKPIKYSEKVKMFYSQVLQGSLMVGDAVIEDDGDLKNKKIKMKMGAGV